MRRPNTAQLTKQVDTFNAAVKVGDTVRVRLQGGTVTPMKTTAEAFVMGGHSAMVMLDGISGAYRLDRVTPGGFKGEGRP